MVIAFRRGGAVSGICGNKKSGLCRKVDVSRVSTVVVTPACEEHAFFSWCRIFFCFWESLAYTPITIHVHVCLYNIGFSVQ